MIDRKIIYVYTYRLGSDNTTGMNNTTDMKNITGRNNTTRRNNTTGRNNTISKKETKTLHGYGSNFSYLLKVVLQISD